MSRWRLTVKRTLIAALISAAGVVTLAACSMAPEQPMAAQASAPYSVGNDQPYCGALGNCNVPGEEPFPLHGSYGAY
ncbi:MAG: hypothetical protein ACREFQ_04450 [Stellaceae bacterium]